MLKPIQSVQQGFEVNNEKTYLKAGSYVFTVPLGVEKIYVAVFGAGGTGAGINSSTAYGATGGGGGGFAGGYVKVMAGEQYPVTVGAGGSMPFVAASTNGVAGGTSSFGTLLTATGGSGGVFSSIASRPVNGGVGGTGFISDGVYSAVTSNGGRGGNFLGATAAVYSYTGGGASGSLFGDGGRGGDVTAIVATANYYISTGGGGWCGDGGDATAGVDQIYTGGGGFFGKGGSTGTSSYLGSGGGAYSNGRIELSSAAAGDVAGGSGLGTLQAALYKGTRSIIDGSVLVGNGAGTGTATTDALTNKLATPGGGGAGSNGGNSLNTQGSIAGGGGGVGSSQNIAPISIFGGGSGAGGLKQLSNLAKNGTGGGSGASAISANQAPVDGGDGAVIILW